MSHNGTCSTDVLIVGAGVTGVATASLLARQGVRVVLVDRWSTYPACFKAEKIEPDQIDLLRKFGLMDGLLPHTARVREILAAEDGRVLRARPIEQFGIFYHDMVNQMRTELPPSVEFQIGRVQDIQTGPELQRVKLENGREYTARLVVLGCGLGSSLYTQLGLTRRMIQKDQSMAFGYNVVRTDGGRFPFDAVTYYPEDPGSRLAFLSLFLIGNLMRANMFAYWSEGEEITRRFVQQPGRELAAILPKLSKVIGDFDVVGKVETVRVDLYRMEGYLKPGVVVMADGLQSVCPTSGMGLSKVLTDVDVLCSECVPHWLSTPGMSVEKIAAFYDNPRKQAVDRRALFAARYNREITLSSAFEWRARRARRRWESRLGGWRDHLRAHAAAASV